MKQFGFGLAVGLVLGSASVAAAYPFSMDGDHYETGWKVLVRGALLCTDPYVRPSEREIECRSLQRP